MTESRHAEVPVGRRVFGFRPFATEVVMTPTKVRDGGFVDGSDHRSALPAPYDGYVSEPGESAEGSEREAYDSLLRPLFTTSFLIADWSAHESYALKHLRHGQGPEVVGLTSCANVESTREVGLYDRVIGYDEIATLYGEQPVVYVDLSGNAEVRAAVHTQCAGLKHDCAVGLTHWDAAPSDTGSLPGPAPVFFFAPAELERQSSVVGRAALAQRIDEAMDGFVARVSDPSAPLMTLEWHRGREAASAAYASTVAGRVPPSVGMMVAL